VLSLDKFEFNEDKHEYTLNGKKMLSVTEVCSMVNGNKYAINDSVLRQAANRGSYIHELTAMYDNEIEDLEVLPEVEGYFRAWLAFERDYKPEWLYIEKPVYSERIMVAGTVDRIGVIDDKLVVVDIKTASTLDRTAQANLMLQLAGYNLLLNTRGINTFVSESMGVQLKADGTYKVYPYSEIAGKGKLSYVNAFLHLANILTDVKGIEIEDE